MKFRHAFIFIPCLIVSVWTVAIPARAATITETYNYSITIGGPIPWFGSVTLTFDPTVASPSAPPDAFSSNLPASYGSFVFITGPTVIIGNSCSGVSCNVTAGTDRAVFAFTVDSSGLNPVFSSADLSIVADNTKIFTGTGTVTVAATAPLPAATPLPAALPLFATGLGALGLLGWRRKRKAVALAA
jgi:hypothetical protein